MKVKVELIIDLEDYINQNDPEELDWLFNNILYHPLDLSLHSNEIGDIIGEIVQVKAEQLKQDE